MSEEKNTNTNTAVAIVSHKEQEHHPNPNPFQNLLSLFNNFKLKLTQPKTQNPPETVTFPLRQELPDPIKLHDDDSEATHSHQNPAVQWQIYAAGAYLIARWAWNQWQKKKGMKNPSDNDEQNDD